MRENVSLRRLVAAGWVALAFGALRAEMKEDVIDAAETPPETVEVSAVGKDETWTLVDVVCDNARISDIVTQFRRATKANIICADSTNLAKRISVTLNQAPWIGALKAILETRGFKLDRRDGVYYVKEDNGEPPKISTRAFTINHAAPEDVAALLNGMFADRALLAPAAPAANGDVAAAVTQPIARPFTASNTVLVRTDEITMEECATVIARVDQPIPQIYIEARFIELSSAAMHKLGLKWNSLEEWGVSLKNITGGMEYNTGRAANYGLVQTDSSINKNINGSRSKSLSTSVDADGKVTTSDSDNDNTTDTTSENSTLTGLVPDAIKAATGAGRSEESMGWANARGFSGQLSVDDFRLALSAFEQMSDAKLFSNPKIIVSNGKEARVDMTEKFPNVRVTSHRNDVAGGNGALDISVEIEEIPGNDSYDFAGKIFFDYGISLQVTPCIAPDGLISVRIVPTISSCDRYYEIKGGENTPYSKYPIIDMKRLITEFTMKDGSTAVIGGLTQTKEQDVDSGIPYLRKIPWIGPKLFGWKSREKVQSEILVFVTVGIADAANMSKDIGLPKNAVLGREYVEGRKFEPGDRPETANGAAWSLTLDKRLLDERNSSVPAAEPKMPVAAPKAEEPKPEVEKAEAEKPVAAAADGVRPEAGGEGVKTSLLDELK